MSYIIEKQSNGQYKVSAISQLDGEKIELLFDRLPCYGDIVEKIEKELRLK